MELFLGGCRAYNTSELFGRKVEKLVYCIPL